MAFGALSTLSKAVLNPLAAALKRTGGLRKKGSASEYISDLEKAGLRDVEGGPEFLDKLAATEGGLFQDLPLRRADIARYTEGLPLIEEPSVAGMAQFIREGVPEVDPSILADVHFDTLSSLQPSPSEGIEFDDYLHMVADARDTLGQVAPPYQHEFLERVTIPETLNYAATTGEQLGHERLVTRSAVAQKNLDTSLDLISSMQRMMESDGSLGKHYMEGYLSDSIGELSSLADDLLHSTPDDLWALLRSDYFEAIRKGKDELPALDVFGEGDVAHYRGRPFSVNVPVKDAALLAPRAQFGRLSSRLRSELAELSGNISDIAKDQAELHTVKWGAYSPYGREQLEAIQTFPSAAARPFQFRLPLDPSAPSSQRQGTAPYSESDYLRDTGRPYEPRYSAVAPALLDPAAESKRNFASFHASLLQQPERVLSNFNTEATPAVRALADALFGWMETSEHSARGLSERMGEPGFSLQSELAVEYPSRRIDLPKSHFDVSTYGAHFRATITDSPEYGDTAILNEVQTDLTGGKGEGPLDKYEKDRKAYYAYVDTILDWTTLQELPSGWVEKLPGVSGYRKELIEGALPLDWRRDPLMLARAAFGQGILSAENIAEIKQLTREATPPLSGPQQTISNPKKFARSQLINFMTEAAKRNVDTIAIPTHETVAKYVGEGAPSFFYNKTLPGQLKRLLGELTGESVELRKGDVLPRTTLPGEAELEDIVARAESNLTEKYVRSIASEEEADLIARFSSHEDDLHNYLPDLFEKAAAVESQVVRPLGGFPGGALNPLTATMVRGFSTKVLWDSLWKRPVDFLDSLANGAPAEVKELVNLALDMKKEFNIGLDASLSQLEPQEYYVVPFTDAVKKKFLSGEVTYDPSDIAGAFEHLAD